MVMHEQTLKNYIKKFGVVYLETVYAASRHSLAVHSVSTRSDENCRSCPETKSSLIFL